MADPVSNGTAPVGAGPTAPSNRTLLTHIRSLLPSLAPAERRVAEAAVADPAGVATKTISQLAELCETSETTVVRFCRAIGIRGYPELRIALASAAGRADTGGHPVGVGSDIGPDDSLDDVLAKVGYADAHAVQDTVRQLDTANLGAVIDAIVAARRVEHCAQRRQRIVTGPVIDVHAAPFGFDEPGPAKLRQVMAHRGFRQAHRRREIATTHFAVGGSEQK